MASMEVEYERVYSRKGRVGEAADRKSEVYKGRVVLGTSLG